MAPLLSHIIPPALEGESSALSPDSSSSNARLTPDSDDDSDLEMDEPGESFKLQRHARDEERDIIEDEDDEEDDAKYEDRGGRRASVSTTHSYQLYTPDEERAVIRKFDRN